MKTERRHELQTNILADWLGRQIELIRPYSKAMIAVAVVVVIAGLAAAYFVNDRSSKNAEGWADYLSAMAERDATKLRNVAGLDDDAAWAGGRRPDWALWAAQSAGDLELGRGLASMFISADEANSALRKAKECFDKVEGADYAGPELRQRSLYGLGVYYESLGNTREAAEHYDLAVNVDPASVLADEARERKESVEDPKVAAWYREFKPWEASRTSMPPGGGMMPGLTPGLQGLPDLPDFGLDSESTSAEGAAETGEAESEPLGDSAEMEGPDTSEAEAPGPALGPPADAQGDSVENGNEASEAPAADAAGSTPSAETPAASETETPPSGDEPSADAPPPQE
jgi:tetratricopeptide (TPR) repeat protein